MSNTFGQIFRITTFGESHGPAVGVVIDGVPANLPVSESDIQFELDRRRPGQSKVTTQRKESDKVEILTGIFQGKTTGAPIALLIRNEDQRSKDYEEIKNMFRPGHADYTYWAKYGIRDYRGGGRASGRETACRVAAGAIAKKILHQHKINIVAYTLAIGGIYAKKRDFSVIEKNMVRAPDLEVAEQMIAKVEEARKSCDSIGGIVEAVVHGCPPGLGEPIYDKLNARLAYALMSIGAIRGVEFGAGFAAAEMSGSQHNDKFYLDGERVRTRTNNAGGILGGISTGEDIVVRAAVKPASSIAQKQQTVSSPQPKALPLSQRFPEGKEPLAGGEGAFGKDFKAAIIEVKGRHDPCICPRVVPVVEAMIAITLVDAVMLQKAITR